MSILTQPPSTKPPSLQGGDPVHNALITLPGQLKHMETIPQQQPAYVTPSPRVQPPTLPTHNSNPTASPRVGPPTILPSQLYNPFPYLHYIYTVRN